MARYWIADLHLGHHRVAEIRGFGVDSRAAARHDAAIMKQLTALTAQDELWILGDISSGRDEGEERALQLLGRIDADLHLIAGNHDSVSSIHRRGYRHQRRWLEVFESVQQFGRVRLHGHDVLMSHYPYARSGDGPGRDGARYLEYRLPDVGMPLIHGHTHQSEPHMVNVINQRLADGTLRAVHEQPDLGQFCVSWDAHRRLVTEHELNQWLAALVP